MTSGLHYGETCNFYGILVNVIKVQFIRGFKVILFKCHWYNTDTRGKKVIRDYYLTSLNVNNRWYDGDPYVLAKQARLVFYIDDLKFGHPWKVMQRIQHRQCRDDVDPESFDINKEVRRMLGLQRDEEEKEEMGEEEKVENDEEDEEEEDEEENVATSDTNDDYN